MESLVAFDSTWYGIYFALLVFARSLDFFSTWMATPNLLLEANPIAKKLGWAWGAVLNVILCGIFALWPLPAIIISTTSVMVASRNFQAAWLMRSMGEKPYRSWMAEQIEKTRKGIYVFCLLANTTLVGLVGAALMIWSDQQLVPFAIGMGIVTYAIAVAFYSMLSIFRMRRMFYKDPSQDPCITPIKPNF